MKGAFLATRPIVFFIFLFFACLNLFIVLLNHYYFRTYTLDYGVYNFAFFDYAHFRVSPCPAYLNPFSWTFLQDHFSLTLFFLVPFYWLLLPLAGTYSLLILQWCFILTGAIATYKLIELKVSDHRIALAALIYYFLLFGRYSAYRQDANLAIMGSALIPLLLYYFELRKVVPLVLTAAFLLLNREDYALWIIFIALFLLIEGWKDPWKRKVSVILMISSFLFFIIIFKFIFPALADEKKKFALFDFTAVGSSPLNAFTFIITHPLKAIQLLFINHSSENYYDGIKLVFYVVYFVSGGFLLLYRPWYLIPFIPLVAKKMYDDNPLRWSVETYYSIEIVSIMPALVFILAGKFNSSSFKYLLSVLICALTAGVTVYKMLVLPPNPIQGESNKFNVVSPDFYRSTVNVSEVHELLNSIPDTVAVSASGRLLPHLAYRKKIYYFPNIRDAEYVVLFKTSDYYPLSREDFEKEIARLDVDPYWRLLEDKADLLLYQRTQLIATKRNPLKK